MTIGGAGTAILGATPRPRAEAGKNGGAETTTIAIIAPAPATMTTIATPAAAGGAVGSGIRVATPKPRGEVDRIG